MAAGSTVPDNLNYLSNISFRLTMQDAPNLTWFCQAINVPGVSIEGIDVFTPNGTRSQAFKGDARLDSLYPFDRLFPEMGSSTGRSGVVVFGVTVTGLD